jgi:hypothetical protein
MNISKNKIKIENTKKEDKIENTKEEDKIVQIQRKKKGGEKKVHENKKEKTKDGRIHK